MREKTQDIASSAGWDLTVLDGRDLWPAKRKQ